MFRPFERASMRSLLDKELAEALARRGLRERPWAVEVDESAYAFLIDKGFSPTLGARPLRRAIEQHVLAPVAAAIVEQTVAAGDQFLFVSAPRGASIEVAFVDPDADDAVVPEEPPSPLGLRALSRMGRGGRAVGAVRAVRDETRRRGRRRTRAPEGRRPRGARRADVLGDGRPVRRACQGRVPRSARGGDEDRERARGSPRPQPLRRAAEHRARGLAGWPAPCARLRARRTGRRRPVRALPRGGLTGGGSVVRGPDRRDVRVVGRGARNAGRAPHLRSRSSRARGVGPGLLADPPRRGRAPRPGARSRRRGAVRRTRDGTRDRRPAGDQTAARGRGRRRGRAPRSPPSPRRMSSSGATA